jgi:glutamyl-tRNA synthetase
MKKIRVRFSPSPTGPIHLGGIRTALYNYLFAKKNKGDFILRIEDTDKNRIVKNSEKHILESLKWCGILPDEGPKKIGGKFGPYRQSERINIYKKYIFYLIKKGFAYYAFDSLEDLKTIRKKYIKNGKIFSYNFKNRKYFNNSLNLSKKEINYKINSGFPYVIRFKIIPNKKLNIYDIIRGKISINTNNIDDKILFKSDGMPSYHIASVIDDKLMNISHIIRGEDWISSTPFHILLYNAFNWKIPFFAHLPLILNKNGKGKLSKRNNKKLNFPIFPIKWKNSFLIEGFREKGYLPEAFINIVVLLGWNPGGKKEIFSLNELINLFSLEKVNKSNSKLDEKKSKWINYEHLQKKKIKEICSLFIIELKKHKLFFNKKYIKKVIILIKERISFIHEIWAKFSYFFISPKIFEKKKIKIFYNTYFLSKLKEIKFFLFFFKKFKSKNLKFFFSNWIKKNNLNFKIFYQILRLSFVGSLEGPDIFIIMEVIGKKESLKRINTIYKNIYKKIS